MLMHFSGGIIEKAAMNKKGFPVIDFYSKLRRAGDVTLTAFAHLAKEDWDNLKVQELTAQLYLLSVTLSEGLSDPNPGHRLNHTAALQLIAKIDSIASELEKLGIVYYVPPRSEPKQDFVFPNAENSKAPVAISETFDDQGDQRNQDKNKRDEREIDTLSAPLDMTDTVEINTTVLPGVKIDDDPGTKHDIPRKLIPPIMIASRSE